MQEETVKEMQRLHFPDNLIEDYKLGKIMVSDNIENKMYPLDDNQVIRDCAEGIGFMAETDVFHVIRMDTPDLGKALIFLIMPEEGTNVKENECHVFRYFLQNGLYCGFGVTKIKIEGNVKIDSEYV